MHGGYGIYYDRITLEIMSLERGLDGRTLPIEVRAGNVFFLPRTARRSCRRSRRASATRSPASSCRAPGAGGINIIDNGMQNPTVQQFNLGVEHEFSGGWLARVDGIHAHGTHFIIGRKIGEVFNPVVGGPDSVINLEDSVGTMYDGLLTSVERRFNAGLYLPRVLHAGQGVQLRQRRPDSVLSRSARPHQPAEGIRSRRPPTGVTGSPSPARGTAWPA